jgi:hypothetical protein
MQNENTPFMPLEVLAWFTREYEAAGSHSLLVFDLY